MTKARGAIIEFALVSKLPDANFLDYRGVAKVVSRQFRVLETVGSSPAASTIFSGLTAKTARIFLAVLSFGRSNFMSIKKNLSLFLVLVLVSFALLSCSQNNIKAIKVDEKNYYTYYLYSFKDAIITDNYTMLETSNPPTKTGYIYSTEKLKPGDSIKVWNNILFNGIDNYVSSTMFGTDAIVDKIIEVYPIKVDSGKETYTITYFDIKSAKTVSDKTDLKEPSRSKIEVTKERVTIEYYAD